MANIHPEARHDYSNWGTQKELTKAEARRNWWYYHKWHVLIGIVIAAAGIHLVCNMLGIGETKPDYYISYVGRTSLPEDTVAALQEAIAAYGEDLNGDHKVVVEIDQFNVDLTETYAEETTEVDEIIDNSQDAYYSYLSDMTFVASSSMNQEYIYLVDNGYTFQERYLLMTYLDGSTFPEDATDFENCYYSVADCPVLAAMELGEYTYSGLNAETTGSSTELFQSLYIGRRDYNSNPDSFKHLEENEALWEALTEGALSSGTSAKGNLDACGELIAETPTFYSDYETDDNNRVFYEIFTGSFSDSDGDGIGDLRGIINRIDYLNDGDPDSGLSLGVEGIWLTPVFESDSYHKYDVNDYYAIDSDFGTMEDLQELISLCHERNVKLILDLPINHTGYNNAWFSEFCSAHQNGDTDNAYYDFYSWAPEDAIPSGMTFRQIEGCSDYYECNFDGGMPELNFDNEAVRQAVLDIASYYLDLGVDGFRFDAAKYIYYTSQTDSAAFWDWYIGEIKAINPEAYVVAEVWDADSVTDLYYTSMNCFCFTTAEDDGQIAKSAKGGNVNVYTAYVEDYLDRVHAIREDSTLVSFIANHDTDRSAGYLSVSSDDARIAANLYLLNAGSSFIYYGEEIGMKGSRGGADTDANRRLAMLWGDGDTISDPEGATFDPSKQVNGTLADQVGEADSLYNYYKRLLMIRKANPEIARGDYEALSFTDSKAGGFLSTWEGSTVCVLHNTTDEAVTLDLSAALVQSSQPDLSFDTIAAVIGVDENASLDGGTITIGARTSVVLR